VDEVFTVHCRGEVFAAVLRQGLTELGVQRTVDLEGIELHALKAKVTGAPALEKRRSKRANSGTGIKQAADAVSRWKQPGHKGRSSCRRQELAEVRFLFRVGVLG
jgi:hypothetical protein